MTLSTLLCFVLRAAFSLAWFRNKNVFNVQLIITIIIIKKFDFQVTQEITGHIKKRHSTGKTFLNSHLEEVQHWY